VNLLPQYSLAKLDEENTHIKHHIEQANKIAENINNSVDFIISGSSQ
tara:strand:+ start:3230 stop:3370 length:141 start_codon:yes stop_codon:yes gene_type:complete